MTNDEIERIIQVILKQQESFASDLEEVGFRLKELADRQDKFQVQQDKLQTQMGTVMEGIVGLSGIIGSLSRRVGELTDAQKLTDGHVSELTDRLNTFIGVVERYISEGRNGKP